MSTHNVCFYGAIKKILCGYPLLPAAMNIIFISEKKLIKNCLKYEKHTADK